MPRSARPADVFAAVAEQRRRQNLDLLAQKPRAVNELVESLSLPQPQVSKHLAVLKKAGLVTVTGLGRQRIYSLNAAALRPVHEWVTTFEQLWTDRLDRLAEYLKELQSKEKPNDAE